MKFNDLKKALELLLPADGSRQFHMPMIMGFPGVGKSALIAEIAAERGIQVIDLRLSQHDNTDFKFPIMGENAVRWVTADFLPVKGNPRFEGTKGILFLDEMNLASADVLASVFQLIYDRRIGDNIILDGWHIVAAGNLGYEDGNDGVVEFSTALRDRILPFILDKYNLDEWLAYVSANGCSDLVSGYIKANPTKLYAECKWQNEKVYVTPRRWEKLGLMLASFPQDQVLSILKYVGEGFLYGEFAEFIEYVSETLNSIEKVDVRNLFKNYSKYEEMISKMGRDRVFQLNSRISAYLVNEDFSVTDTLVKNFNKYITSLSDDLKVSFLRDIKNSSIENFGKEVSNTKPAVVLIKKLFEHDKALDGQLTEIISKGLGFKK